MKHYDYIFAGAGLSSLMTVYKMMLSGKFSNKSILLIDPDSKKSNDRTWCFWEEGSGKWDAILYRQWKTAVFSDTDFSIRLDLGKYIYKMIRGIDFYNFIFTQLDKYPNAEFLNERVTDVKDAGSHVTVNTFNKSFTCSKLFNNIYDPAPVARQKRYPLLQQHFIGWHIKTSTPAFNDEKPTFMDFSVAQKSNTRFMYVLPFSPYEAIVEYTLFSKKLLAVNEYEAAIQDYLEKSGIKGYTVIAKEKGSIPMTSYPFWNANTKNIINIGSVGGWTKASTGYTFKSANKRSSALVDFLQHNDDFRLFYKKTRFWYYDLLLLDILAEKNEKGASIFSSLFRDGNAAQVFKFLDEETTPAEDLKVIMKCPKDPFIRALMHRLLT